MTLVPGTAADPGVNLLHQAMQLLQQGAGGQLYLQTPASLAHHADAPHLRGVLRGVLLGLQRARRRQWDDAHALNWQATARRPG